MLTGTQVEQNFSGSISFVTFKPRFCQCDLRNVLFVFSPRPLFLCLLFGEHSFFFCLFLLQTCLLFFHLSSDGNPFGFLSFLLGFFLLQTCLLFLQSRFFFFLFGGDGNLCRHQGFLFRLSLLQTRHFLLQSGFFLLLSCRDCILFRGDCLVLRFFFFQLCCNGFILCIIDEVECCRTKNDNEREHGQRGLT